MSSKDPVRTLVLPLQGATAVLPQAGIAEIVSFSETRRLKDHRVKSKFSA